MDFEQKQYVAIVENNVNTAILNAVNTNGYNRVETVLMLGNLEYYNNDLFVKNIKMFITDIYNYLDSHKTDDLFQIPTVENGGLIATNDGGYTDVMLNNLPSFVDYSDYSNIAVELTGCYFFFDNAMLLELVSLSHQRGRVKKFTIMDIHGNPCVLDLKDFNKLLKLVTSANKDKKVLRPIIKVNNGKKPPVGKDKKVKK